MNSDKTATAKSRRSKKAMREDVFNAMERLVVEYGFESISMRGFCAEAKITQRSFYNHYKNIDDLYMQFAKRTDYWLSNVIPVEELAKIGGENFAVRLMANLHLNLRNNKVMQKILLWGLNTTSQAPRDISRQREVDSVKIIEFYEQEFEGSDINISVFIAILIGSIYYLTLHSDNDVSTFVGVDFLQKDSKEELDKMVGKLIELVYREKEREKKLCTLRESMEAKGLAAADVEELLAIAESI